MKGQIKYIIFIFLLCPVICQSSNIVKSYIHISKDEGISHNNITAISDDPYGLLWIGSPNGLDLYDSKRLKNIEKFSGIHINILYNSGKEMLIGTSDFLEVYDYNTGVFSRIRYNEKDIDHASSIFRFQDNIIVLANGVVYNYRDKKVTEIKINVPYKILNVDKFDILWGLVNDQVYKINAEFNILKLYKLKNSDLSPSRGMCMYPDSRGTIWIGTVKDGLYRYNRAFDDFYKEDIVNKYNTSELDDIGCINEDEYDRLWIGHNNGLSVYDYTNNYFKNYILENSYKIKLNTAITNIYKTKNKNMVFGTRFSGFFYIKELNSSLEFYSLSYDKEYIGGIAANGIVKDKLSRLWVSTNCKGISILDNNGRFLKRLDYNNSEIGDNIISLALDEEDNVWTGGLSTGLYRITPNNQITHYINHSDNNALDGNEIHVLFSINMDSLLVASNRGLDIFHKKKNIFTNIIDLQDKNYNFYNILNYEHNIYIVSSHSLFCFDRQIRELKEYTFDNRNIYIQCGHIDKNGKIWLCTKKGEIFFFDRGNLVPYVNIISISNISEMQSDGNGNLWLSSGNNLFCVTSEKEIRRFNLEWGLGENEFNIRSSYTDKEGFIYFGASDWLLKFDPTKAKIQRNTSPILFISALKLFNELVKTGNTSLITKHINHTDKLVLENGQNFISFEVLSIDYNSNQTIPYKCMYKLENFDNNWYAMNPASNEISFTGLTTGNYTLHIKLETYNGNIMDTKQIEIEVNPPVWLSFYMILLYIIVLTGIIWIVYRFLMKHKKAKALIIRSKMEQAEMSKLNAMKLDFFTNISHEFKTPLAIISTLQDELLSHSDENDSDTNIFKRNVKRLEYLIKQLMEFRNIESQYTPVEIDKYDIIDFICNVYEAFIPLYKQKQISYEFISNVGSLPMLFDSDKIEMLIGNLLSNVFKHTQHGGSCYLRIVVQGKIISVDIFNSGPSLTEKQKIAIFQPYNKTNISDVYSNGGIGLAIVNSIAKLLNLNLSIIAVENKGNIFRIEIPVIEDDNIDISNSRNHYSIVDHIIDNTIYIEEQNPSSNNETGEKNLFYLLLVEDDGDTKKILKRKLQKKFHVLIASCGNEALLILKSQNVDIVISDISIPDINGYELCKAIKNNEKTKHIPVLLITSILSAESKVQAFQHGADVFLQKPINMQELFLRLSNILKNKNILRSYYSNFRQLNTKRILVNNADEVFIKDMTNYIYDHLQDSNMSVNQLAQHLNISRTLLYLKTKRLTDQTPSSFILNIKMSQAKEMLQTTNMTSSEISYKLGYCNPNYFSRQFKEFYNMSPSEFRKQQVSK